MQYSHSLNTFFFCLFLAVVIGFASSAYAQKHLFYEQTSFAHSEALPLNIVLDGWKVPYSDGEFTQGFIRSELGVQVPGYRFSLLYRIEAQLKYNSDTVEFIHRTKNKDALDAQRKYDILLDAYHFDARGFKVGFDQRWSEKISTSLEVSFLQAKQIIEGKLYGDATAISEKDYDFNLAVDYRYSEDHLFDRKVNRPEGYGFALDFSIHLNPNNNFEIDLSVFDLFGLIYWENAPRTDASASSGVKHYDELGYVIYEPVLSGWETTGAYTMRLKPRTVLTLTHHMNDVALVSSFMHTSLSDYLSLESIIKLSQHRLVLGMEFVTTSFKIGYAYKHFSVDLMFDNPNYKKTKAGGLNLVFSFPI